MPPINLDEIIHYDPSAKRTQFETRQAFGFKSHPYPELFGPVLNISPSHDKPWRPSFALPAHPFSPSFSYLSPYSGMSTSLNRPAVEAIRDYSHDPGMEYSAVNLEHHPKISVSTVRSPKVNMQGCSGGGLRLGLQGERADDYQKDEQPESHPMTTFEDSVPLGCEEEITVSTAASVCYGLDLTVAKNENVVQLLNPYPADEAMVDGGISREPTPRVDSKDGNKTAIEDSFDFFVKGGRPEETLPSGDIHLPTRDVETEELNLESPISVTEQVTTSGECGNSVIEYHGRVGPETDEAIPHGPPRQSTPRVALTDRRTTVIEESLNPLSKDSPTGRSNLRSDDAGALPEELILELPTGIASRSAVTRGCKNSSSESHEGVGHEIDAATATASGTRNEQQHSGESLSEFLESARNVSLVYSPSPTCQDNTRRQSPGSRREVAAEFCSVSKRPSVVITNLGSQARQLAESVTLRTMTISNKKRDRCQVTHKGNIGDGCDDPDDADYVNESRFSSRRSKRTKQTAVQLGTRNTQRTRRKAQGLSVDEVQTKVAGDPTLLPSLSDIETIPIRGFMTRQVFLSKVVYSVTFEEQAEHACMYKRDSSRCEHEDAHPREERPHHKAPRSKGSNKSTEVLPEDDRLLIELKEQRGLPWKQIAEYFPGRSKGSLQVRYSTRLKRRHIGGSVSKGEHLTVRRSHTDLPSETRSPEVSPVQRYGPSRRRRTVDRYSPAK